MGNTRNLSNLKSSGIPLISNSSSNKKHKASPASGIATAFTQAGSSAILEVPVILLTIPDFSLMF
jgi:hypothetical protein